ncbi:MAG: hypothetical protein PHR68_01655 [Candidatus Gracilibacteria bacterium]|nr:hypothetical protein [Candidatus Gracilibacteria bacterium]
MFAIQNGREFKLSIAEILAIFPTIKIITVSKSVTIFDGVSIDEILEKSPNLGGSIKIMEIREILDKNSKIPEIILNYFEGKTGKIDYGINTFPEKPELKKILIDTKKILQANSISSRFVNKDFRNLSSVQITHEKLIKKETDLNFIFDYENLYFATSIFVQDIEGYGKRDFDKERSMQTGMLPPKLAQIMLNLAGGEVIYDPFVGLGTVLIEAILNGSKKVFGSDLSSEMVKVTSKNLEDLKENFKYKIIEQNSKYIQEIDFLNEVESIVTEGYLGEIMTQKNISSDRIDTQKKKLRDLYIGFFSGLQKLQFKGNIVISFPFWEMNKKYFYFEEVYEIINKYCEIQKLLPEKLEFGNQDKAKERINSVDEYYNFIEVTKAGSLLYKRDNQLVGREIFKLQIK